MTDDLISRAEAMTELQMNAERYTVAHEAHGFGTVEWCENLISVSKALEILRNLPTVDAVQHWIPVSEEMPDEYFHTGAGHQFSDYVLVTLINHANDDERFVDTAYTQDGIWRMVHTDDGDCEVPYWCELIAWMPLPKSYEAERKEE